MALESATYLDDLVVSNPAASDAVGQADDHIRMLKSVLKTTFPNIDGAVTATPLQLNYGTVPIGTVCMWFGSTAALPTNWKLCDGTTVAKSDGSGNITLPDLRSVFIKGCGGTNAAPATAPTVGTTGGSATHTHTPTVNAHVLTQAELPNCSFTVTDGGHAHTVTVTDPGHYHTVPIGYQSASLYAASYTGAQAAAGPINTSSATTGITAAANSNTTGITVASGGSGTGHSHTSSLSTDNGEPPYYVLAFIAKI